MEFTFTQPPIALDDLKRFAEEKGMPWTDVRLQLLFIIEKGWLA